MALLFMDGFEYGNTNDDGKYDDTGGGTTTATARTGTRAGNTTGSFNKLVPASGATAIVGFGFYHWSYAAYFMIENGAFGSVQIQMTISTAGKITISHGGGTIAATTDGIVKAGTWNYIEWKTLLDQTAGTVTVKVNGNTVISETGKDTCGLASTAWDRVRFGWGGYFDDLYVADGSGAQNNDFLGECRVVTLLPSDGNGSNTDFTCSSASDHGALVNETTPNDDTDYVYSSTLNHVDTWNYPALGYTGAVKGVQMTLWARKTDSGTRAIAAVTRPASTNRVHGTTHYLGTNYIYWPALWELNPEDSAAWEVADVDGAEFGVKVTV